MQKKNYQYILKSKKDGKKLFAVLIDPDKFESTDVISKANRASVDFILVGGSILSDGSFEKCIQIIKKRTKIPVIIFPGNHLQISKNADGILLLSLISGRNPELLIGKQVIAAPLLKASQLELLPTGYILIESGKQTSASYMSNTTPIPADKTNIAACTAMAGEQLGLQLIYMDAGSGAIQTVSEEMIKKVSKSISIPLIVGGGIDSPKKALLACKSGADVIVVGNAIEKNIDLLESIAKTIHTYKK